MLVPIIETFLNSYFEGQCNNDYCEFKVKGICEDRVDHCVTGGRSLQEINIYTHAMLKDQSHTLLPITRSVISSRKLLNLSGDLIRTR